MIGRLHGILLEKTPPALLIDAGGVGWQVDVPMSTLYGLPDCGQPVTLHIHHLFREDGQFLFGFASREELAAFRALIKVSGIGARMALAVLSGLSVADLVGVVTRQEAARLVRIPGIGKKTAERLLLELRDKLGNLPGTPAQAGAAIAAPATDEPDPRSDILNALLALGYNEREAARALDKVPESASVADGIRLALRQLSPA